MFTPWKMRVATMTTFNKEHEYLKYRLRCAGWTITSLAQELGVVKGSISKVCQGVMRSQRIETFIAEQLETTPAELWPQHFQKEDEMI